ncbi:MAG: prepilin peptidase [Clostridiaceae bacterium]
MLFSAADILLVIVLIICFITDIKYAKIYNAVIFPGICIALIINIWNTGLMGLKVSLFGFVIGLAILLVPYLMGGMGAGDVKLLAFIGTLKGSIFVLNTALFMGLIGGAIAVILMISKRQLVPFFKSLFRWIVSFIFGLKYKLEFSGSEKYPYGIAIVIGAFICLLFKEAWII